MLQVQWQAIRSIKAVGNKKKAETFWFAKLASEGTL
jgi:hypothetical protein